MTTHLPGKESLGLTARTCDGLQLPMYPRQRLLQQEVVLRGHGEYRLCQH